MGSVVLVPNWQGVIALEVLACQPHQPISLQGSTVNGIISVRLQALGTLACQYCQLTFGMERQLRQRAIMSHRGGETPRRQNQWGPAPEGDEGLDIK